MRDRELRNAIRRLAAVRHYPRGNAIRRAAKMRQHLTARAECIADKVFSGAQRDDLAMVDDGNAIAQTLGFFHIVRRVDERHALAAQLLDHFENIVARLRVYSHGGFIHQDQLGLMYEAGCHVKAPLHASRKILDQLLSAVGQGGPIEASGHGLLQHGTV